MITVRATDIELSEVEVAAVLREWTGERCVDLSSWRSLFREYRKGWVAPLRRKVANWLWDVPVVSQIIVAGRSILSRPRRVANWMSRSCSSKRTGLLNRMIRCL